MTRLAAVDIGSNTVHVLVADRSDGGLTDVAHYVETPMIGEEVARAGRIGKARSAEALAALASVLGRARALGFEALVAGATEAVRRADDGAAFLERAAAVAGVPVHLISPDLEARLSFAGVASRHAARKDWLMVDLGGGSTEVVAARGGVMRAWVSLPIGTATAAAGLSDPPLAGERAALRASALKVIRGAPECDAQRLVMTGGTAANLPLILSRERPPAVLTTGSLLTVESRLDAAPAAEIGLRSELPDRRVRSLRAGVEMVLLMLDYYGLDRMHVSYEGLRHGMILRWIELGDDWWR